MAAPRREIEPESCQDCHCAEDHWGKSGPPGRCWRQVWLKREAELLGSPALSLTRCRTISLPLSLHFSHSALLPRFMLTLFQKAKNLVHLTPPSFSSPLLSSPHRVSTLFKGRHSLTLATCLLQCCPFLSLLFPGSSASASPFRRC